MQSQHEIRILGDKNRRTKRSDTKTRIETIRNPIRRNGKRIGKTSPQNRGKTIRKKGKHVVRIGGRRRGVFQAGRIRKTMDSRNVNPRIAGHFQKEIQLKRQTPIFFQIKKDGIVDVQQRVSIGEFGIRRSENPIPQRGKRGNVRDIRNCKTISYILRNGARRKRRRGRKSKIVTRRSSRIVRKKIGFVFQIRLFHTIRQKGIGNVGTDFGVRRNKRTENAEQQHSPNRKMIYLPKKEHKNSLGVENERKLTAKSSLFKNQRVKENANEAFVYKLILLFHDRTKRNMKKILKRCP